MLRKKRSNSSLNRNRVVLIQMLKIIFNDSLLIVLTRLTINQRKNSGVDTRHSRNSNQIYLILQLTVLKKEHIEQYSNRVYIIVVMVMRSLIISMFDQSWPGLNNHKPPPQPPSLYMFIYAESVKIDENKLFCVIWLFLLCSVFKSYPSPLYLSSV